MTSRSEQGPGRAGENLLAISGIGGDDEAMLDGVRVFDVATGSEVAALPSTMSAACKYAQPVRRSHP